VIFDELRHLPATSGQRLEHIPSVRLTATPVRNDEQRLPGDIAYAYPLRPAVACGV
jgi:superfamily II DNA or RNA helicase